MMELNKITSNLEILGNSILRLEVENELTSLPEKAEKSFGMDVDLLCCEKREDTFYGEIILTIEVGVTDDEEQGASFAIDLHGAFQSPIEGMGIQAFKRMLLINGATALYGIARSKMEVITGMTFAHGKLSLPFVNIIEFYKDKFSVEEE